MSDLETILTEIRGVRSDNREDTQALWKAHNKFKDDTNDCLNEIKSDIHEIKSDIDLQKGEKKKRKILANALYEHLKDTKMHYDGDFKESIPQRAWRKRLEVLLGGALGVALIKLIEGIMTTLG